jgi:hypothetical protein
MVDLFKGKMVRWAMNKIKPYKAPGPDGILLTLLQKGIRALLLSIVILIRPRFPLGYLPKA